MICQLCSFEFDAQAMICHSSCVFNKYCTIICCPNCGFQTADESRSWLAMVAKHLLRPGNQADKATTNVTPDTTQCSLNLLQPGQSATIVKINTENETRLERLQLFGLIPGAQVLVEQRNPEFVLRVDYTSLTVERRIAKDIIVKIEPAANIV